jgi:exodeoxyribonuclease VII large subunit
VTLGRERLAARAQRLPRPEALLAAPTQRLDDLGERARRGLGERIVVARTSLQRAAGRLSVPLLAARLARASDRLGAVRLAPALLTARIAAQTERLAALRRLMQSLNPDNILDKGFVRVTGPDGHTLMTRAQAASVPALSLHFRDGVLAAVPADGPISPPRPVASRAPASRKADAPEQGKLL